MKYLVAVSGGIDSVVLLHKLVQENEHELIVAHFDHGIRDDSADDARFVGGLASQYGLPFVTRREELGKQASEEQARARRYEFLHEQADKHQATIVTAHHAGDVIETIAINLTRGTGWRGLAVLSGGRMIRPLLSLVKSEIRDYALEHRLEWVEDSTNASDDYLRNRLRHNALATLPAKTRQQILKLWQQQCQLKQEIDRELTLFLRQDNTYDRHFLTQIDQPTAEELLRAMIAAAHTGVPTRPQAQRALLAVKTARPGTIHHVGAKVSLAFTARTFVVRAPS